MSSKVDRVRVTTLRKIIEVERKRLKSSRKTNKSWWTDRSRSDWARREFGENLDGEINDDTLRCQMEICQICGKDMPLDEEFIRLEFSFCDEYSCGMNACQPCLKKLSAGAMK